MQRADPAPGFPDPYGSVGGVHADRLAGNGEVFVDSVGRDANVVGDGGDLDVIDLEVQELPVRAGHHLGEHLAVDGGDAGRAGDDAGIRRGALSAPWTSLSFIACQYCCSSWSISCSRVVAGISRPPWGSVKRSKTSSGPDGAQPRSAGVSEQLCRPDSTRDIIQGDISPGCSAW